MQLTFIASIHCVMALCRDDCAMCLFNVMSNSLYFIFMPTDKQYNKKLSHLPPRRAVAVTFVFEVRYICHHPVIYLC